MRVCVAQYDILWEDKHGNMAQCEQMISDAASARAELIVFPELSLTGFSMDRSLAERPDDESVSFFTRCAKEYGIACIFGYAAASGDKVFNNLVFINSDGTALVEYSKLHPFSYGGEAEVYSAGQDIISVNFKGMSIGLTICYDLRFPELYQRLSKDCGCIVVSASWPQKRQVHWDTLLKARAIECQSYILGCNRTGEGGGLTYCGGSAIISPAGDMLATAQESSELIYADISEESVKAVRDDFPVRKDRRIDLYRNFYE